MIQHLRQPEGSSLCGQTCIAMAAGVTIDEAVRVVKSRGGTTTKKVIKALRQYGIEVASERLLRNKGLPKFALVKMRFKDEHGGWQNNSHWILYWNGVFYDPGADEAGDLCPWGYLSSYIELIPPPPADLKVNL